MDTELIKLVIESGGIAALSLFIMFKMFQRFMGYIENHMRHNTDAISQLTEAITDLCGYLKRVNGDAEQLFRDKIRTDKRED